MFANKPGRISNGGTEVLNDDFCCILTFLVPVLQYCPEKLFICKLIHKYFSSYLPNIMNEGWQKISVEKTLFTCGAEEGLHMFTVNRYKLVINNASGINENFWKILIGDELIE